MKRAGKKPKKQKEETPVELIRMYQQLDTSEIMQLISIMLTALERNGVQVATWDDKDLIVARAKMIGTRPYFLTERKEHAYGEKEEAAEQG